MKAALITLASAGLIFGTIAAQAGESPGKQMKQDSGPGASEYAPPSGSSDATPGQQMKGDTGPGASQYAPGQNKEDDNTPGASADAPGHNKPSSTE